MMLFIDGSVNPKTKIGYGAYLICSERDADFDALKNRIKTKCFRETSSSRLELQTLLWALSKLSYSNINLYTDSQNIISLGRRKESLEKNEFRSKSGRMLKNHELYRAYFRLTEDLHISLNQVVGHKPSKNKSKIDRLFSLVDKASRKASKLAICSEMFTDKYL
ncbi:MAG: RNase H family protein [Verrucomicrobiota bacterium]